MFCWRSREQAPCVQSAVYLLALLFWRTSIIFYKVQNVIFCICQLNQTFWFSICFISQQNFSLFCTLFKVPFSRAFFRYYRRNDVGLAMAGLFLTIKFHLNIRARFPAPAPRHLAVLMLLCKLFTNILCPPPLPTDAIFISCWACKTWPNHFKGVKECVKNQIA